MGFTSTPKSKSRTVQLSPSAELWSKDPSPSQFWTTPESQKNPAVSSVNLSGMTHT